MQRGLLLRRNNPEEFWKTFLSTLGWILIPYQYFNSGKMASAAVKSQTCMANTAGLEISLY